jgi:hypothetical protein
MDPYEERCPFPEPSSTYSSGSPVKELPPPGSRNTALTGRDVPFPGLSFNYLSNFPVNAPPSPGFQRGGCFYTKVPGEWVPFQVPSGAPMERVDIEFGHLFTRSGLTRLKVSLIASPGFFCYEGTSSSKNTVFVNTIKFSVSPNIVAFWRIDVLRKK